MIKRKHIDHADLVQLGKMLLLLIERPQIAIDVSSLTELNKQETEIGGLARAS
jgi:hypothetical protein